MTQHPIDLLPESMRVRSEARAAASRNATIAIIAAAVLIATITHARLISGRAERQLDRLSSHAEMLDQNERQALEMHLELQKYRSLFERYHRVENPVPVSRLLATIVREMPESAALDRIALEMNAVSRGRRVRGGGWKADGESAPRVLVAELAGFARDDMAIASLVEHLDATPPLSDVSLDFSRQRIIHERSAREFRLSFTVDFEPRYVLSSPGDGDRKEEAVAHAE